MKTALKKMKKKKAADYDGICLDIIPGLLGCAGECLSLYPVGVERDRGSWCRAGSG